MSGPDILDTAWLAAHPLPDFGGIADKNERGQVVVIGGGPHAPAAPVLTAEAAFRVGCGRVRIGVPAVMVPHLSAILPEAGYMGLDVDEAGGIRPDAIEPLIESAQRADAVAIGPGMSDRDGAAAISAAIVAAAPETALLLDSAACASAGPLHAAIRSRRAPTVLTPHPGEMAGLMDCEVATDPDDCRRLAIAAAERFGAIVASRGSETWVAAPDGRLLHYEGGGVGLATGGSGDVGIGIVLGLLGRGVDPFVAAAWGTWVHGEAGRRLGEPGFLAREILPMIPALIRRPRAA